MFSGSFDVAPILFIDSDPVPEYVFNAFNGQYLKVAIGKGLITIGQINELFVKYADFF